MTALAGSAQRLLAVLGLPALLAGCACDADAVLARASQGDLWAIHEAGELGDPVVPPDFVPTAAPPLQDAFASLAPVLSATDTHTRLMALESLRRLAQRAPHVARDFYPDVFEPAFADPDPNLRWRAAWALGRLERTSPGLRAALADRDPRVAERAAWALGRAGDEAAVPGLIEALEGPAPVAASAEGALERISGRSLGPEPDAWRAWWERVQAPPPVGGAGSG